MSSRAKGVKLPIELNDDKLIKQFDTFINNATKKLEALSDTELGDMFDDSFSEMQKQIESLQEQFEKFKKTVKDGFVDPSEFKELKDTVTGLQGDFNELTDKMEDLKLSIESVESSLADFDIKDMQDKVISALEEMKSSAGDTAEVFEKMIDAIKGMKLSSSDTPKASKSKTKEINEETKAIQKNTEAKRENQKAPVFSKSQSKIDEKKKAVEDATDALTEARVMSGIFKTQENIDAVYEAEQKLKQANLELKQAQEEAAAEAQKEAEAQRVAAQAAQKEAEEKKEAVQTAKHEADVKKEVVQSDQAVTNAQKELNNAQEESIEVNKELSVQDLATIRQNAKKTADLQKEIEYYKQLQVVQSLGGETNLPIFDAEAGDDLQQYAANLEKVIEKNRQLMKVRLDVSKQEKKSGNQYSESYNKALTQRYQIALDTLEVFKLLEQADVDLDTPMPSLDGTEQKTYLEFYNLLDEIIKKYTNNIDTLAAKEKELHDLNITPVKSLEEATIVPIRLDPNSVENFQTQIQEVVNIANDTVKKNGGISVPLDFKTEWGKKQEKKALQQLKDELAGMNKKTKKAKEYEEIIKRIETAFEGRFEVTFKDNWDPINKRITDDLAAIKKEAMSIPVHLEPELSRDFTAKLQEKINDAGKGVHLSLDAENIEPIKAEDVVKTDEIVKEAEKTVTEATKKVAEIPKKISVVVNKNPINLSHDKVKKNYIDYEHAKIAWNKYLSEYTYFIENNKRETKEFEVFNKKHPIFEKYLGKVDKTNIKVYATALNNLKDAFFDVQNYNKKNSDDAAKPLANIKKQATEAADSANVLTEAYEKATKAVNDNSQAKEKNQSTGKEKKEKDIAKLHEQEASALERATGNYGSYVESLKNANDISATFVQTLTAEVAALNAAKEAAKNVGQKVSTGVAPLNTEVSSTAQAPVLDENTIKKASDAADRFFQKVEKFAKVNELITDSVEPAVKAMGEETPYVKDLSEAFGEAATNSQDFAKALNEIPDSLKRAAIKEAEAKKLRDKAANEPTIKHNDLTPFLDRDSDAFKSAIKAAEDYEDVLGKIAVVTRSVVADAEVFNVTGTNGKSIQLARDTEGGWTKATDVLVDHREELEKTLQVQKEFIKQRDKLNDVDVSKYLGGTVKDIDKLKQKMNGIDLLSSTEDDLKNATKEIRHAFEDIISSPNTLKSGQQVLDSLQKKFKSFDVSDLPKRIQNSLAKIQKDINDYDLTQHSREQLDRFKQKIEDSYDTFNAKYKEAKANIKAQNDELKKSQNNYISQSKKLNKVDSSEYTKDAAQRLKKLQDQIANTDITAKTSKQLDKLAEKIEKTLSTYAVKANKISTAQSAIAPLEKQFNNLDIAKYPAELQKRIQDALSSIKTFDFGKFTVDSIEKFKDSLSTEFSEIQTLYKAHVKEIENADKAQEKAIERHYQKEQQKLDASRTGFGTERDTLNNIDPSKYISDVAEIIRKVQDEVNAIDLETAPKQQLDDLKIVIKKTFDEYIKNANSINGWESFFKKIQNIDPAEYGSDVAEIIRRTQSELANIDLTKSSRDDLDKLKNKLEKTLKDYINTANHLAKDTKITGLAAKISQFYNSNTAMPQADKRQMKEWLSVLHEGAKLTNAEVEKIAVSFNQVATSIQMAGKTGNSLFQGIIKQAKSANAQFFAMYFSIYDWIRYMRQAGEEVIKIDSALTELRKVSNASTERLAESFEKSAKSAQELGQNIQHVINVTADWARLGKGIDEAEELARITTMFTTVGDNMSADDASSYLISTLQGFQLAADDAERVIDKYNEVECCLHLQ